MNKGVGQAQHTRSKIVGSSAVIILHGSGISAALCYHALSFMLLMIKTFLQANWFMLIGYSTARVEKKQKERALFPVFFASFLLAQYYT